MSAEKAECGTVSGYNRHRNDDESPCDACREAKTTDKSERRDAERAEAAEQAQDVYEGILLEPEPDRLFLLKEQRDLLRAHSQVAPPQSISAISRQLSAILAEIAELEASEAKSVPEPAANPVPADSESSGGGLDEVARRRANRERRGQAG